MPVYGYLRVSTLDQADGSSLEDQERRIRGVAMARGGDLDGVFADRGVSGSLPLDRRPQGKLLCRSLSAGDVLIVAKLDRAFRNAADALTRVEGWKENGVQLIVADMGTEPVTGNGVAKLFFGMLALVAEFERERILERTLEGKRTKAARGGHIGGSPPFGYRVEGTGREAKLVEDAAQQTALRTIHRLAGRSSLRAIAGVVAERHGIRVSHEAIRRILGTSTRAVPPPNRARGAAPIA